MAGAQERTGESLAKTARPRLAEVIARERLFALIDERRRAPLVWISGPAGSGKTTLVASYLEARGVASRWYQIDAGDADVGSFFYYMSLAAGAAGEPGLERFTAEYRGDVAAFSSRFFQRLFAALEPPFVLVLDDHHELPTRAALDVVIGHAVAELPAGGSVMVLSRAEPPASMARLRANRSLESIGWADLRLTRAESDAIARAFSDECEQAALARLYARTQGWAAGLVLMLAEAPAPAEAADPDAPQVVFDYLAGEVFDAFDDPTRALLLRTAVLPGFTGEMAAELTGEADAGERLAAVHRGYRLVSQQAVDGDFSYRYHPLLREFLNARAAEELGGAERRALRRRAAGLLRRAGRVDAAIGMLGEAGDSRALAGLLAEAAPELVAHGRAETLQGALERLPEELLEADPWLAYWLGTCRFHEAPREARLLYERAYHGFPDDEPRGPWLACAGAMDAIIYELDDLALLDVWIDEAGALVARHGEPLDANAGARFCASMFMALVFRQPWHAEITPWAQRTYQRLDAIEDVSARLTAQLLLAINLNYTGQFSKARDFVDELRRLSELPGAPPLTLAVLKDVESMFYMLTADHDRCVRTVYDGFEVAEANGVHLWTFHILSNGVAGALAAGDVRTAREFLARMHEHRDTARRLDLAIYHYCSGWLATLAGEALDAYQALRTALRLSVECGCPFYEILCRLALAPVCVECGDEARAAVELRRVRRLARRIDNRLLEFMSLLGYAHLALEDGRRRRRQSGLNALRYAMGVGREFGFRHFLGWRPAIMARLCERALAEGIEPDYVRKLVRERGLEPDAAGGAPDKWPWPLAICSLGGFRVFRDGQPLEEHTKIQQRPMELLRAIVALGAENVPEAALAASMWPRIDDDYALKSLTTNLFRLRKMLGEEGAVVLRNGRLSLDPRVVRVDVRELEQVAAELDGTPEQDAEASRLEAIEGRLLALYRGPFMAGESEAARDAGPREHLRNRFLRGLSDLARLWEAAGAPARVPALYRRALEVEPLAQSLYRRLMLAECALGRHAEAVEVYERCARVLRAEDDTEPSPETRAIYERAVREL